MLVDNPNFEAALKLVQPTIPTLLVEELAMTEPGARYSKELLRRVGYMSDGGAPTGYLKKLSSLGAVTLEYYPEEDSSITLVPNANDFDFTVPFAEVMAAHWRERSERIASALNHLEQRFPNAVLLN